MEIKGKVALVTGGGSGIGQAIAIRLAREGAAIMLADLDQKACEGTRKRIIAEDRRAAAVAVDVCNEEQMSHVLERTLKEFGRLDILHNNAGIALGPPGFPKAGLDQWRRVLDVDLQAVILGCYLAAPIMERGGGGVIINTASMAGLYPHPTEPIYGAAKAGVVALTYALASWAKERSIRVNCLCPGIVDTPLVQRGQAARAAAGLPTLAPSRMLQADDIADAALELVRDDSIFGRAMEIRPNGRRLVEPPRMPGARP